MSISVRTRPASKVLAVACAALLTGLGLVGCGGASRGAAEQLAQHPGHGEAAELGLQGLWGLQAEAEPDGTVLNLSGGYLSVLRPCATFGGTWAARGGLFLGNAARVSSLANLACPASERAQPAWLDRVAAYRKDGADWDLLDSNTKPIAHLKAGASVPADRPRESSYFEQETGPYPSRDDRAQSNTQPALPLPSGVQAPSRADVLGRWKLVAPRAKGCDQPFVEFRSDGTWRGHDSGSPAKGRWVMGEDGLALGAGTPEDAAPCANLSPATKPSRGETSVDLWMLRLARLGLQGGELIFYDFAGAELQRVERATAPAPGDDIDHDGLADSSEDGYVDKYTPVTREIEGSRRDPVG
ncbi:hypothetical protein [Sporichthya polymorpha]|uniref:hypothetical protein n=1 Tax=Sporichthya polymorpha TaxID=35751 RepID=UPI0012EC885D|nr:hypothetical protein [Sporichthya polymorpha]